MTLMMPPRPRRSPSLSRDLSGRPARPVARGLATTVAAGALVALLPGSPAGAVVTQPAAAPVAPLAAPTTATAVTSRLPIDLPSAKTLRAKGRKVFAHYMPSLPVSLDNRAPRHDYWARHYLNPDGERGKHAAYGGFVRDRPKGRGVRAASSEAAWKLADFRAEVRQARSAGIDGFTLDLLSLESDSRNLVNARLMLRAARQVDRRFSVMLMPDMTTSVGRKTPAQLARGVAALAKYPSAYRLKDGRLVVSPFKAENHSAAWWKSFLSIMRSKHKIRVAFVPTFLDERPHLKTFGAISYGMSNWGNRNPRWNTLSAANSASPLGRAKAVRARGLLWMQPVGYQDERPVSGVFEEAQNTQNLRNSWRLAIRSKARWVQLTTWNDYTEGSHVAPSVKRGWVPLDISAYYLSWFKTGRKPAVRRTAVYLTHRTQRWAAKPTYARQTKLMRLRGGTAAQDRVEALVFSPTKASVRLTVGSVTRRCVVPAGVHTCTAALRYGTVKVRVTRHGRQKAAVSSPFRVVKHPRVQDLQYVSVGSLRD